MLQRRAAQRVHASLDMQAQRLDSLSLRLSRPAEGVRARRQQLALLGQRLLGAGRDLCDRRGLQLAQLAQRLVRGAAVDQQSRERRLDAFGQRLDALDPQHVLARGYAWLTDDQGRVLHSVRQLAVGQDPHATLADGHAELSVAAVAPEAQR